MDQPLWKMAYDAAEKRTAPTLEKLLGNPDVLEAITLTKALQRRAQEDLAGLIQRQLNAMNLPSATDLRDVSNQIAGIERQLRLLDRRMDDLTSANGGAADGGVAGGGAAATETGEDDD